MFVTQGSKIEENAIARKGYINKVAVPPNMEDWENPVTVSLENNGTELIVKAGNSFVTCGRAVYVLNQKEVTKLQVIFVNKDTMLVELLKGAIAFPTELEGGKSGYLIVENQGGDLTCHTTEYVPTHEIDVTRVWDYTTFEIARMYGYKTKDKIDEGYYYNSVVGLEITTLYAKAGDLASATLNCRIEVHPVLGGNAEEGGYVFVDQREVLRQQEEEMREKREQVLELRRKVEEDNRQRLLREEAEAEANGKRKTKKAKVVVVEEEEEDDHSELFANAEGFGRDEEYDEDIFGEDEEEEEEEDDTEGELFTKKKDSSLEPTAEELAASSEAAELLLRIGGGRKII